LSGAIDRPIGEEESFLLHFRILFVTTIHIKIVFGVESVISGINFQDK